MTVLFGCEKEIEKRVAWDDITCYSTKFYKTHAVGPVSRCFR